ncbi:hypothetical protein LguiA_004167 [Lonicera macranthoides]
MRKAIVASGSVQLLFNVTTNSSFLPKKTHFSIPIRNCNFHHPFDGELKDNRLVQLLQHSPRLKTLDATKSLHALSITMGSNSTQPIFVNNNIISNYESLGYLSLARKVFDKMPQRSIVSYNTMVRAYCSNGKVEEAWEIFKEMRSCGFELTQFTFGSLLSCASLDLDRGSYLQGMVIKSGLLYADAFAGTALLGLFGRHGCLDEAIRVFDEIPQKNLVTWNTVLSLFGQNRLSEECILMFRELMKTELTLSEYSFVGILSGFVCEQDLELGEQIHGLVIKSGFEFAVFVANPLMNMYGKCSGSYLAEKLFEEMPFRDIVSWNTIIGAQARSDKPGRALELFFKIYMNDCLPNMTTFVNAINCCAALQIPVYGEFIHAKIIKNMFETDVFVGSALVDFYAKCDRMQDAHRCFDEINEKSLVSWNALMLGYSNRSCSTSLLLLREMIQLGYCPNEVSFSIITKSSSVLELQQLHSLIIKMGYHQNEYVSSSLITSYAKNGVVSDASLLVCNTNMPLSAVPSNIIAGVYNRTDQYHKTQELFSLLEEPDMVSWNILITACSRNGDYKEVFELFQHMQIAQVRPDNYTYVSLLSVCTKLCNLALGSSLHALIIKTDFTRCDTFVCNILIDMYGKCGSLLSAVKIFNETTGKNVISWTALVSSLGLHGYAHEALERFREMDTAGFKPDRIALMAVLSACRHVGLVKEGMELFGEMKWKYGVKPDMDHYVIMVDLLARYGDLKEAERLIAGMPFPPNALIWRSFLEGCKRQRTIEDLAINM